MNAAYIVAAQTAAHSHGFLSLGTIIIIVLAVMPIAFIAGFFFDIKRCYEDGMNHFWLFPALKLVFSTGVYAMTYFVLFELCDQAGITFSQLLAL